MSYNSNGYFSDISGSPLDSNCSYNEIEETSKYISDKIECVPVIGVICGSGLGGLANILLNSVTISYSSIPNFPRSSVPGHAGELVIGTYQGVGIVCMKGRFHFYEGYPLWKCCFPIRVMQSLGVRYLVISNAAGSVNETYNVGDIMIIKDHINFIGLSGSNPLKALNKEVFSRRFVKMAGAYNRELIQCGKEIARDMNIEDRVKVGIYACLGGPNYETVAEMKFLKFIGADAVGMSTAHEVIMARYCEMTVFAFSFISNTGIIDYDIDDSDITHDDVLEKGKNYEQFVQSFVQGILDRIVVNIQTVV